MERWCVRNGLAQALMSSCRINSIDSSEGVPQDGGGASSVPVLRECIEAGVIAVDAAGTISMFNATAGKFLGMNPAQALSQPIGILPEFLREIIERTLATGQPVSHSETSFTDLEGPAFTITTAVPRTPEGEVIVLINDLAAARTLEQKMEQLDRLASIGTLSASMAHEIKNALVAVSTFVELLLTQNKDAELAEIVAREMKRIDSIVSQMLRFAGPAKPTFAPVEVHEVLQHALRLIRHQLEGRKVHLQQRFGAATDVVRGDRYQLQQAFVNLLFNAMEAMGASAELTVTTDVLPADGSVGPDSPEQGPKLRVVIKDNGVGIAEQDLPKLFDAFFTTKPNGTGLGLSITRRIIQEHRGAIEIESEVSKGTSFSVILPLADT